MFHGYMKYIYANLIYATDFIFLSDSVGSTSSVRPEKDMREVNVLILFSNDQI